ncbi:MAG TPA: MMPL family transporter [Kineosporiaceae bacterium]|nr:MMPL family transporter [Kineosporiaceae bacterium]
MTTSSATRAGTAPEPESMTLPQTPLDGPVAPGVRRPRRSPAAWCAEHRWRTLFASLLVLAGAVLLLGGGITTTKPDAQLVGDSAAAVKASKGADFGEKPTETVVVTARQGRLDPAVAGAVGRELAAAYTGLDGVASVGRPTPVPDGRTMVLAVALDAVQGADRTTPAGQTSPADAVGPMMSATGRVAAAHPELKIGQVGPGSIDKGVGEQLNTDFRRAELFSLPVTLAVLLIAFGAVVAAGVPVLLGVGAVAAALGLTALASRQLTPVDQNTQSLVLLIGLAVGVDYALFVIRRSREERAAGAGVREAITRAGATAGRAVVISGITVVVAMSGMLVAGGMYTSLAIGAMLVVGVAVLASATVLPAMLSVLGDKVEALRLPFTRRRAARRGSADSAWGRLAALVARRPLAWTLAAGAVLVALAVPALGMKTSLSGVEGLPQNLSVVDAYKRLVAAVPQDGTTVDVVVRAPAADAGRVDAALRQAFGRATATGYVNSPQPKVSASTDGQVHTLALAVPYGTSDPKLGTAVDAVRAEVVPAVQSSLAGVPGAQVHVGGAAAVTDLTRWMDARLPWVVGFVLVLTFVVMLLSFGSPWLAAATVGLNLLSVGAAYGVMTLVFQHGWGEGLLGFTSIGSIAAWLPLLMFVILFGLSMDYHVFVVSRVREAYSAGHDPRTAVRLGVARSAGVVTSAAAVMVAVFAIFGTLSMLEMKELGVGLATAVFLDATLVRGIMLPAVLALLGRRAHSWPRWIPVLHH